jgi:hypothetical protein
MTEILLTIAGIAVPSVVIVAAIRRWIQPVSWRMALLLLAIVLVFIGRGVFTPGMPVPLDEVMRGYPFRGVFGVDQSKNYLTNDTVKQILPWMHAVREQMLLGHVPLWDPYLFGGYPLLGNGQSAPFSPFFLATLFVPLPKQLIAMAGLKLFVALLFGYLLMRREGANPPAALFGSLLFAFAIFNNVFLYYPMTAVTLLLPASVYAVLLCLRRPGGAPFVLVALVVAALLAGGHPESVFHVAIGAITLVAIEWISPQWDPTRFSLRDFVRVTCAALVGLMISAPAWVPVLEQARISLRVLILNVVNSGGAFPVNTLWAMLNPDGYGNPAHGNYGWIMSYTHVASVYVGLIAMVLFLPALISPRSTVRDRLLALAAILFLLLSLNWTILARIAYAVPPFSWIAHDRLRFVYCLFVAIASSRVVSRLRNWDLVIVLAGAAIVLPLSLYVFVKMYGQTLTAISAVGMAALLIFVAGTLASRRTAAFLACALTAIELFVFTFDYNAITDRRFYAPRVPIIDAVHRFAAAATPEPFRILGLDWMFLPNSATQYGLEDVRGSDPMEWIDYVRFFRVAEAKDTSIDVKRIVDPNHVAIDFLNVRYLLTYPNANLGGKWQLLYSGVDGELYENAGFMSRFFIPHLLRRVQKTDWEGELRRSSDFQDTPLVYGRDLPPVIVNPQEATITCRAHGPTDFRLRVATPRPVLVASSQPAMPGWRVRVNNQVVQPVRINGAFLGFWVPAGVADVSVRYRAVPFRVAVGVAVFGFALLMTGAVLPWNRRFRGGVAESPAAGF